MTQPATSAATQPKTEHFFSVSVERAELLRALHTANNVADTRSSSEILKRVLFSVAENRFSVRAYSGAETVEAVIPAQVLSAQGLAGVALPGKMLADIVKQLPAGKLTIAVKDAYRTIISSGRIEFKINGLPPTDFPSKPGDVSDFITLDARAFSGILGLVAYSVSSDDTRFHLNGVFVRQESDALLAVSTDGHRLSMASCPLTLGSVFKPSVILPRTSLRSIFSILAEESQIEIARANNKVVFRSNSTLLFVNLIDAAFPSFEQIIPTSHAGMFVVSAKSLFDALGSVKLVAAGTKTGGVKMQMQETAIVLSADDPDAGEARVEVEGVREGGVEDFSVGINAEYLRQYLHEATDADVEIRFTESESPLFVVSRENKTYQGVIMPMRL